MSEKNNSALVKKECVSTSISLLENLLQNCPDPTQNELRKLLAIQGTVLNNLAIQLLESCAGQKRIDGKIKLAMKAMAGSRASIAAAAGVKLRPPADFEEHDQE
jgi:hypothetical protein